MAYLCISIMHNFLYCIFCSCNLFALCLIDVGLCCNSSCCIIVYLVLFVCLISSGHSEATSWHYGTCWWSSCSSPTGIFKLYFLHLCRYFSSIIMLRLTHCGWRYYILACSYIHPSISHCVHVFQTLFQT